jgi:hypothetical protein
LDLTQGKITLNRYFDFQPLVGFESIANAL